MLSAALARSACQPCSSHTAAHHRVLTLIVPAPVCSCQTHPFCLPSPSSAHLNRRTLRQCSRQKLRTSCASTEAEPAESPVGRNGFEWATNVSRHGNVYFAIDETSQACVASMDDSAAEPTVALFFASSSYSVEFDRIVPVLRSKVPSLQHIIGCTVSLRSPVHLSAQRWLYVLFCIFVVVTTNTNSCCSMCILTTSPLYSDVSASQPAALLVLAM